MKEGRREGGHERKKAVCLKKMKGRVTVPGIPHPLCNIRSDAAKHLPKKAKN